MNDPHRIELPQNASTLLSAPRRLGSALLARIILMSTTKANYWLEFAVTSSLSTVLLAAGLRQHRGSWAAAFFTVLVGLLFFSFLEYVTHRWIFHGPASMYRRGHDAHHVDPRGYDSLPFFLPSAILLGLTLAFSWVMPAAHACLVTGSIAFGYVAYGFSHFAIHATRFRQPWIRHWAARHHVHHYHPDANFGVTTSLWDRVLGTHYRRDRVKRR